MQRQTQPLEAMRDTNAARVVSLAPSVNMTPVGSTMVPVPYNVVDFAGHDEAYAPTVRFTGQRAMLLRSFTQHVHGDAAGTGGGVKSKTVGGICEPIGHAPQVRAEGGSPLVRHLDRCWMNNRNTVGECQFVRDTAFYAAPKDSDPIPGSAKTFMSDAVFRPGELEAPGGASSPLLQTVQATTTAPQQSPFAAPPGQLAPAPVPRPAPTQVVPSGGSQFPQGPSPQRGSGTGLWPKWLNPFAEAEAARRLLDGLTDNRVSKQGIENTQIGSLEKEVLPQMTTEEDRAIVEDGITRIRREALPTGDRDRAQQLYDETIDRLVVSARRREAAGSARISADPKCRSETICFDKSETDDPEIPTKFDAQLKMQQDALNAKAPADVVASIPEDGTVGSLSAQARTAQVAARNEYIRRNRLDYLQTHTLTQWNAHMAKLNGIHRLDMVAGGKPTDVIGMGDAVANQTIGREWPADRRRGALRRYAAEMAKERCPLNLILAVCRTVI